MSLQSFIETYESIDYGNCEEVEARKDTFCIDFFQWRPNFSMWSSYQYQTICGKINYNLKDAPQ